MIRSKKCQVSVEAAIAVGIIFLIFALMLFFAYRINTDKKTAEDAADMENECIRLSSIISGMYIAGEGSHSNVTVEHSILVENSSTIFIRSEEMEVSCRCRVPVTDSSSGTFNITSRSISIVNNNGSVIMRGIQR